ncbi:MAG: hypothetical protein WAK91_14905 [Candidatus Acidiferrales bacterium]
MNPNNKFQIIRLIIIIVVVLIFLIYRLRPLLRKSELPPGGNSIHSVLIVPVEQLVQVKT